MNKGAPTTGIDRRSFKTAGNGIPGSSHLLTVFSFVSTRLTGLQRKSGKSPAATGRSATRNNHTARGKILNFLREAVSTSDDHTAPAIMIRQSPNDRSEPPAPLRDGHKLTVLVVEDNLVNQQILAHYLTNFGVAFEIVPNGLKAVEAVRTGRFDLVFMDIQMPVMDGVAATRAIRALPGPESAIPIFAVTAHAGPDQDQTYLQAGMNGVIAKPVPAALLHRTLNLAGQKASA
jgi:two-component system, sensor histidine kinase